MKEKGTDAGQAAATYAKSYHDELEKRKELEAENKQLQQHLDKAMQDNVELRELLMDFTLQYCHKKVDKGKVVAYMTGGMRDIEDAFNLFGWDNPQSVDAIRKESTP